MVVEISICVVRVLLLGLGAYCFRLCLQGLASNIGYHAYSLGHKDLKRSHRDTASRALGAGPGVRGAVQ